MPPTSKSFLSHLAEGELCLKKLPPRINLDSRRSSARSLKPGWISILPDEVLSEIFSHLPPRHWWNLVWNRQPKEAINKAFPLALVCKRWQRIYEPRLYHELGFLCKPESGPGSRFRRILAILTARPRLYRHVRSINLHINDNPKLAFQDLANDFEEFTGLRTVTFSSCYPEESRCLLEAIKRLPLLEDLTLRGVSATVSIPVVLQNFLLPSLKRLKLSRYGVSNSSTEFAAPDRNWKGDPPPLSLTQTQLEQLLPPAQYLTGNVVSMAFEESIASFNITEHLLRWPTRLVELSITSLWYDQPYTRGGPINTTEVVQRFLCVHQQSLKRIRLGMMLCGRAGMPNFSDLPNLEDLRMSTYNTRQFETPPVTLQKLAAPKLQCFAIDFFTESQYLEERAILERSRCSGCNTLLL